MAGQVDVDEANPDNRESRAGAESGAAARQAHLATVESEAAALRELEPAALNALLREIVAGSRRMTTEALVRLCGEAHRRGDRRLVNLSFEACAKTATPLLLSQAFGQAEDERAEQVQEILLLLFADIRAGKARLAERFFASFAKRRAVDLFRKRDARLEGKLDRREPEAEVDPVDELPDRAPSLEARVLLSVAVDRLPQKVRTAFIQKYRFQMTQEEIAEQNGVTVRTVYDWLDQAAAALGLKGDDE